MPGVYYTTTEFLDDAKSAARDRGMPGIRTLALPADKYYVGRASPQELQPIADAFFDKMVDALTRPLTAEEAKPSQAQLLHESANIKLTGKDFQDASAKVNDLFLDNRWADGLPIIPPTPELVKAMEEGAKPEYFTVILAAMEGFLDKHYDLTHVVASTGSFTPVVLIDGPIAKELNFNSGIGMLGHGWRA